MRGATRLVVLDGFKPQKLGADLLAYWDARRTDLITLATGVSSWKDIVRGYDAAQASSTNQPAFSASSFGGEPAIVADGVDDYLSLESQPFPSGASPSEIWALVQQDLAGSTAGTVSAVTYGGATSQTARRLDRSVAVPSTNRGTGQVGNGSTTTAVVGTNVNLSTRHVMRLVVGASAAQLFVDGVAEGSASVVPATGTTRLRIFANTLGTPGSFWKGSVAAVLVCNPLPESKANALQAYLAKRRNL